MVLADIIPHFITATVPHHAPPRRLRGKFSVGRMGFGPTYVAHIPPLEGWYSRDSLCYGVGARVVCITAKAKKKAKVPMAVCCVEDPA